MASRYARLVPHDGRPGVPIVVPAASDDGPFSDFAVELRDVAAVALSNTGAFWTKVTIEDVYLDGPSADPRLVILLKTREHPASLYGLRATVSDYHPEDGDPESWAGYIHDEVMEAVDAAPGLPTPTDAVTWVDL